MSSLQSAAQTVKAGDPFTKVKVIKYCGTEVVQVTCPEKLDIIETITLSAHTGVYKIINIRRNSTEWRT